MRVTIFFFLLFVYDMLRRQFRCISMEMRHTTEQFYFSPYSFLFFSQKFNQRSIQMKKNNFQIEFISIRSVVHNTFIGERERKIHYNGTIIDNKWMRAQTIKMTVLVQKKFASQKSNTFSHHYAILCLLEKQLVVANR